MLFVLVVRWPAVLPGDQRRKSGLYFRGKKEREKTMYTNASEPVADYMAEKQMFGPSALIKR